MDVVAPQRSGHMERVGGLWKSADLAGDDGNTQLRLDLAGALQLSQLSIDHFAIVSEVRSKVPRVRR